jgi:hypothetical protein
MHFWIEQESKIASPPFMIFQKHLILLAFHGFRRGAKPYTVLRDTTPRNHFSFH